MKTYLVQITNKALSDMEDIYHYIANTLQAPETAMNLYNKIANSIEKLDIFPERFKIMESAPEQKMELRRLQVDNYIVFFTIQEDRVIVTRVLYSASDIGNRLNNQK